MKQKKKKKFEKKNSKWPIFQNGHFSKSPILKTFLQKFHGLALKTQKMHFLIVLAFMSDSLMTKDQSKKFSQK